MNPRHQNRTYHIFYLILQFENKKGTTIWELIPISVFQTKRYNPACFMQFDNKKACNYRTFINWPSYQPTKHKKLQTCSSIRWEANLLPIGVRRCYVGSPVTMWSRRADAPRRPGASRASMRRLRGERGARRCRRHRRLPRTH
jgi:hypothetical protein